MAVAKKIFSTVSDSLAKRLDERASLEGRSGSSLVAYLLEKAMDDWDELRRAENAQPVPTTSANQPKAS